MLTVMWRCYLPFVVVPAAITDKESIVSVQYGFTVDANPFSDVVVVNATSLGLEIV